MRVGVDGKDAADVRRQTEQVIRWVLAFGTAVDLDRGAAVPAGREHRFGVELRLRPPAAAEEPPCAVPQDVYERVTHGGQHPRGHRGGVHPQLRMHAGDHDIQLREQIVALVERAVIQDVHLYARQDAERRQLGVEPVYEVKLRDEPFRRQPARHGQPGGVVGQCDPAQPQIAGGGGHLSRRAAAVGPVRVSVAVAVQGRPQAISHRGGGLGQQAGQVLRLLAAGRLLDDHGGGRADAGERAQSARVDPLLELAGR